MTGNFQERIAALKKTHDTLVLAHNYQLPEIQDAADFVGDSLDLALKATKSEASTIVFCGVSFMAEAAKILNPEKTVILPDPSATCPMANMVDPDGLRALKKKHPKAAVMAYINTNAEIKALADVCCTSANGVKMARSLPQAEIIFVPDANLGDYIQRRVPEKRLITWPGYCRTHQDILVEDINALRQAHPDAEVLVHPECRPEVVAVADHALSTNGMVEHAKSSSKTAFIIGTEKGLVYRLSKEMPAKTFYPVGKALCPNMKKITIEKLLKSMETSEPEVCVPEPIMRKAKVPLERMMQLGRGD